MGELGEVRCSLRPFPFLFLFSGNIAGAFACVVVWAGGLVWYKRAFYGCLVMGLQWSYHLPLSSSSSDILLTLSKRYYHLQRSQHQTTLVSVRRNILPGSEDPADQVSTQTNDIFHRGRRRIVLQIARNPKSPPTRPDHCIRPDKDCKIGKDSY